MEKYQRVTYYVCKVDVINLERDEKMILVV